MKNSLLVLSLLILISLPAYAFDGERKGLVIDAGAGPGLILIKDEHGSFGGMTDIEVGYALNNRFMVHALSPAAWYKAKWYYQEWSGPFFTLKYEEWVTVHGLLGLGGSYFLQPQAPSLFFTAGAGLAYTAAVGKVADVYKGFGISVGGGYEFARHWRATLKFIYAHPGKGDYHFNLHILRATVDFMLY